MEHMVGNQREQSSYEAQWDVLEGELKQAVIKDDIKSFALNEFNAVRKATLARINEIKPHMNYSEWIGNLASLTERLVTIVQSARVDQQLFECKQETLKQNLTTPSESTFDGVRMDVLDDFGDW